MWKASSVFRGKMKTKTFFKKNPPILAIAIIVILFSATNAFAAGGTLDSTFGMGGIVSVQFNNLPSTARDIALQTDGKVLVLGSVSLGDEQSAKVIARYNSNGALDTSFGGSGIVTVNVPSFIAMKLALQPDGKIILGGLNGGYGGEVAVARYLSNGTLDTSFGVNGKGTLEISGDFNMSPADLVIQPDGKIVLVGDETTGDANYTDFFIARFDSNGAPDPSFVGNGWNILDYFPNNRYNYGMAAAVQPDNKIVISGNMMDNDGKAVLSLARVNADGSLDKSGFGTNGTGTVSTLIPPDFQTASGAIILQPDGKIIVGGTTAQNLTLVRYNSNGTLDTSFGGTGIVNTDLGADEDLDDLVLQTDGKIIVEGKIASLDTADFLLARYNSDGSLDATFGANGKVVTDFGGNDTAGGIAAQPDGKVIVIGASGNNAILARYDTGVSSTVNTVTFKSVGAYDGWILESGENTSKGGTLDKVSNVFRVGDETRDRQYRGFLSFDTSSIPDNAIVTSAQIRIKRQGIVGIDPFKTHGNLFLEIRNGTFSNGITLNLEDFSAISNIGSTQDIFSGAVDNWHTATLSNINLGLVNRYGPTQFRLMFTRDDNDDLGADYIKFFSGNSATDLPQLVVTYSTTGGGGGGTSNHAPVINGGAALSISIPENTMTVTGVTATDADGQPITYSISGLDAGKFSISPSTGLLTFLTAPDFEAIPLGTVYHVTAQASDGMLAAAQDIAVTVTAINEYAPVITSNGGGSVANISLPENTIDVTTITATDADLPTQPIEYINAGGADGQLFNLDPSTGKLSFITAPSYNAPNDTGLDHVYNVKVEINDGEFATPLELVISIVNPNPAVGFTTLHQFGNQADNGRIPYGVLVPYNGVFYGTTTYGGAPYNVPPTNPANKGNVFRMNMDGTGFTVLHEFTGGANDGWKPWSGLAISGDMVYGSTVYGGPRGEGGGVIYEMNVNGSGFRVLHAFGEPGDGFGGSTSPILVGDTLYGITRWGGNGTGTIYSYNTTTEVYKQLYRFAANSSEGNAPLGTLTAANDGYLYGLTWLGGKNNMGTLFRIRPDGTGFETMYHFAGGTQGKYPYDTLTFDGNHTLYGTTLGVYGVDLTDLGVVFKYDIASKTYSILHKFAGGTNDGGKPNGSVVLSSDGVTLYGTTHGDDAWGGKEYGILYQMNIDGSSFQQLYEFKGGAAGATPMRTPLLINGALYGMTAYGGTENYGLIYRYQVANPVMMSSFATMNVNLYSPTITSGGEISIPENGTAVTTIAATDADIPTQTLTYSILGGVDSALFAVNPSTGELTFLVALDYELPTDSGADNIYNLTVQAFDGTLTTTQDISVTVTGITDNVPLISSNGNISIPENTPTVTTLTATDADLPVQPLTYSIIGGADAALFAVNQPTGELTFLAAPDYEQPKDSGSDNIYNLTVQVSDGTFSTAQDVIVTVSQVNDNKPMVTSPASFSVQENATAISTLTATDADLPSQPLTYSIIGGADSAHFTINSTTGVLSFIVAHDYELPNDAGKDNIYNLTIQASDGTLAVTQEIAVSVVPVNDNAPLITSLDKISIVENTNTITTLTATDADRPAQPLTYSIISGLDSLKFSIVGTTGELKFVTAPDFEIPSDSNLDNVYEITVQVSDGVYNATKNISVQITNGDN
jgi:uncharacterized delta-60 repeat protein